MRYFKILNAEGNLAAFGRNDTMGTEITEAEYNELCVQYAPLSDEAEAADYEAALRRLGVE